MAESIPRQAAARNGRSGGEGPGALVVARGPPDPAVAVTRM